MIPSGSCSGFFLDFYQDPVPGLHQDPADMGRLKHG